MAQPKQPVTLARKLWLEETRLFGQSEELREEEEDMGCKQIKPNPSWREGSGIKSTLSKLEAKKPQVFYTAINTCNLKLITYHKRNHSPLRGKTEGVGSFQK